MHKKNCLQREHGWQDIRCRITQRKGWEEGRKDTSEKRGVKKKLHGEIQEGTININLPPASWTTSTQVGVVSIAVSAIYLMYWPITTSPLWVPDEGSPAVSQQANWHTIDWGVIPFLPADPHSCLWLLFFLYLPPPCIILSASLSHSCSFFLPPSVHSLRIVYRRIVVAFIKINIILIQTDMKRHQASKPFLCRLLISSCFSTPFIFCSLIPFDPLFRGLLWVSLDRHVWAQFRCYIWQVWWSSTENPWAAFFWDISLCDKYPRYWHTKALQQRLRERHALNVILIFHKISQE